MNISRCSRICQAEFTSVTDTIGKQCLCVLGTHFRLPPWDEKRTLNLNGLVIFIYWYSPGLYTQKSDSISTLFPQQ